MNYRVLPTNEWHRLVDYLETRGHSPLLLPAPETALAAIAENDEGEIVGLLLQQLTWHREPLILDSPRVRFDKLNDVLNQAFTAFPGTVYYAFTEQEAVVDMAKSVGMQPLEGVLLRGEN